MITTADFCSPARYAEASSNGKFYRPPHIQALDAEVMATLLGDYDILVAMAPPRHGKLLADSTPIWTPSGWKTHGELMVGDYVYSPRGLPVKVIGIGPKSIADLEVTFADGSTIKCHKEHEWYVTDRANHRTKKRLETQEILRKTFCGVTKNGKPRARCLIDYCKPLQSENKPLELDPYVLGVWLGDGKQEGGSFCGSIKDVSPIEAEIARRGWTRSWDTIHQATGVRYVGYKGMFPIIRKLGLAKEKFIPTQYLTASESQRRDLLSGLVDTDGSVEHGGRTRFVTCSTRLASDVAFLVRTLGYRATTTIQQPHTSTSGIVGKKQVYTVQWSPHDGVPQGRLPRKSLIATCLRRSNSIQSVKPCEPEQGNCIQVEGGLYLAGENLIATHNSEYLSKWLPSWFTNAFSEKRVIAASYSMSLSRLASRFARDQNHKDAPLWGRGGVNRMVKGATDWQTVDGGGMLAAGVGGGITGRAADLFLIDDCLKNAEQALSETIRQSQWEWWQTTAFTRLEPGGKMILLGCLVADTPVSVPGGSVPIKDIRPGDIVETFRDGKLSRAKVSNHACVGQDMVFCITLKSGRIVLGNERHPFLVSDSGVLKWVRLKNLQVGSRLIVNASTPIARTRYSQEESAESTTLNSLQVFRNLSDHTETEFTTKIANGMDAKNQQSAKDSVESTIQNKEKSMAMSRHHFRESSGKLRIEKPISNIVTELPWSSMSQCLNRRVEYAQSAESHPTKRILASIKTDTFSSITAMAQTEFEGSSATHAILQQDTLKPLSVPMRLLDTSVFMSDEVVEIRPEGVEDVYDLEVEETENFIANGIVTHNTRWHSEDLLGRVLEFASKEKTLRVREVRFPAIAELDDGEVDIIGRKNGEALWPQRYSIEALQRIRSAMDDYWWQSLYQQKLTQYGSNEWPESYFWGITCEPEEWPKNFALSATALDPSKGKDSKKGDFQAIVNVAYKSGTLWIECDIDRRPIGEMIDTLVSFNERVRPTVTGIESVAFQELLAPVYIQAQIDHAYYDSPELIENTVPKRIRIARLGYWLRTHRVKIKNNAAGQLLIKQLRDFPYGDHDDGPDAMEMALRLLLQICDQLQEIMQMDGATDAIQVLEA